MNHVSPTRTGDAATGTEVFYRSEFAMGEHSAGHLRRILRLYLKGSGLLELGDAAELALTELIANVVRHVPGRRCQTCIHLWADGVRVEVADQDPRLPRPCADDELADGGRGLLLVAAVTDRWGVEPRPDGTGKTVWFECLADRKTGQASSASTASVNGGQTSVAQGPKARSVSATQAAPAAGSTHRNVPDWPKWPKVAGEEELPVQ